MEFRLYGNGDIWFRDKRMAKPVRFAHIVDLHLPPLPTAPVPEAYRSAIQWWNIDSSYPHEKLPRMLDDIKEQEVDFVFFGGDVLDCFDQDTAAHVVQMCEQRNLACRFQLGNHDAESLHARYVTHEFDAQIRRDNAASLCEIWRMPDINYTFMCEQVRFVAMDCLYYDVDGAPVGVFDDKQLDWLVGTLAQGGPIVIFHHVPLTAPTLEHRLRAIWNGQLATMARDTNTDRFLASVANHPDVLGTFVGHAHIRSEDPLGQVWQFMTAEGCAGHWRYVCISADGPPKSMRVPGEPVVESCAGSKGVPAYGD